MWLFDDVLARQRDTHNRDTMTYSEATMPTSFVFDLQKSAWKLYTRPVFETVQRDIVEGLTKCRLTSMIPGEHELTCTVMNATEEVFTVVKTNAGDQFQFQLHTLQSLKLTLQS